MEERRRNFYNFIKKIVLLGLIVLVFSSFVIPFGYSYAYSDEVHQEPTVLQDLHKDEKFNEGTYPVVADDYSLKVIQIAESVDNELFVYVYQPCSPNIDLWATSINISTAIDKSLSYKNYKLSLLSVADTLYKYRVENFIVKSDIVRYYDISSIFRAWNEKYDERPQDDNDITDVSYTVASLWTATTHEGKVSYTCTETETVTITDKYVGFIRYENDFFWGVTGITDSHYIAFSTDKQIDNLIEADVYFTYTPRWIWYRLNGEDEVFNGDYGSARESYAFIKEDDVATNNPNWLFPEKYVRDRIQSVDDFISEETGRVSEETTRALEGKQWILRFFESEYYASITGDVYHQFTSVEEVTILRLKFETDGVTYNLGVVDNKQTGSETPDNIQPKTIWEKIEDFWNGLTLTLKILFIIGCVLVGLFVIAIIYKILKAIWDFARGNK